MSFPRLTLVLLPVALGLPLLVGACGGPVAVAAVSYGTDGVSLAGTGKTTTDHFASIVTKKDCAMWRFVRNQNICREREGDKDPYDVNYNEPFRDMSEGGGRYDAPLRPAPGAPATSWDAATYKPALAEPTPTAAAPEPSPAPPPVAVQPEPQPQPEAASPPKPTKPKAVHVAEAKKKKKAVKKPSPNQVAQVP